MKKSRLMIVLASIGLALASCGTDTSSSNSIPGPGGGGNGGGGGTASNTSNNGGNGGGTNSNNGGSGGSGSSSSKTSDKQRTLTLAEAKSVVSDMSTKQKSYKNAHSSSSSQSAVKMAKNANTIGASNLSTESKDGWDYGDDYWKGSNYKKSDYDGDWTYKRDSDYSSWGYQSGDYSTWLSNRSSKKQVTVPISGTMMMITEMNLGDGKGNYTPYMRTEVTIAYDFSLYYIRESAKSIYQTSKSEVDMMVYYTNGQLHAKVSGTGSGDCDYAEAKSKAEVETAFGDLKKLLENTLNANVFGDNYLVYVTTNESFQDGIASEFSSDDAGNLTLSIKGTGKYVNEGSSDTAQINMNVVWNDYLMRSCAIDYRGTGTDYDSEAHTMYSFDDGCKIDIPDSSSNSGSSSQSNSYPYYGGGSDNYSYSTSEPYSGNYFYTSVHPSGSNSGGDYSYSIPTSSTPSSSYYSSQPEPSPDDLYDVGGGFYSEKPLFYTNDLTWNGWDSLEEDTIIERANIAYNASITNGRTATYKRYDEGGYIYQNLHYNGTEFVVDMHHGTDSYGEWTPTINTFLLNSRHSGDDIRNIDSVWAEGGYTVTDKYYFIDYYNDFDTLEVQIEYKDSSNNAFRELWFFDSETMIPLYFLAYEGEELVQVVEVMFDNTFYS